jgi:UDP-N-acetylmuramoyl-L-alanyl-D-glutamate--2,6-diaminopimelate ligase
VNAPDTGGTSVASILAAAERDDPRPLATLVERLAGDGRVRGARRDDLAIGAAGIGDVRVRGVTDDSRAVRPGMLFVAVPGFHVDGHDFVALAAASGAAAAIVEQPVHGADLPQLVVDRTPPALATAAAWWYGDPSRALGTVGITGTDGKTTTAFLTVAALESAGIATGLVGTVETKIGSLRERHEEHVTTPGAPVLQATLAAMRAAGDDAAVVETTSHALALDRVGDIAYDAAIFTNLTHEHLELHGSWEAYRDAKLSLFARLAAGPANPATTVAGRTWPKAAIVNLDDPTGTRFAEVAEMAGALVLGYGTDRAAAIRATSVEEDAHRLRVAYTAPSGPARLELRLAGRFNVHNALAVVALGEALGLDPLAVRSGLEGVRGIPGRMERIDLGQPFAVVVDYAHSPASLQVVLDLLAPIAAARGGGLIAVFGSAGERDTAKRPVMGRIAGERCRLVVVTDEDPRGESRDVINEAIAQGAEAAGRRRERDLLVIADRREAIAAAFERARPGDVVLLAGKGHERTILYADGPIPWDEASEAAAALERIGYGAAQG